MNLNIGFIWLIFLLGFGSSRFAAGYKCNFQQEDDPEEYYCKVVQDSSEIDENHISGKTDDDVNFVRFDADLLNISHYTQSESTPFCQKFKKMDKIMIKGQKLKSIDENSFQNCKDIKLIEINSTDIQELPENLFPENLKLTYLWLSHNQLTTLPENIFASQTELEYLSLNSNPFTFLSPDIFKPLRKLKWLYLDGINLNLNPKWFRSLKSLIWLNLINNKISDLPKNILSYLKSLLVLDLSYNQLKVIHSDSFGLHPSLGTLHLFNNNIYAIDEKFIDNTGVYWLDMRGNNCSKEWNTQRAEVKDTLAQCLVNYQPRKVQEDYKCKFYEADRREYTCEVNSITSFDIKEQHEARKDDKYVETVKFDGITSSITNLTSDKFLVCKRFRSLHKIYIKDAKFVDEDFLYFCDNLKVLDIQNAKIEEISKYFLIENPFLTKLFIQGTNLKTLPENIFMNQQELVELHLHQNQISSLPDEIFNPLKKLRDLWLQGNKIQILNPKWFEKLSNLATLDLSRNQIAKLPNDVFSSLENLKKLVLSFNQLTTINSESFGTLQKLTQIDFLANKIDAIDEKLIDNTGVSMIDMQGNVCSQDDIKVRDDIKESLRKCFEHFDSIRPILTN